MGLLNTCFTFSLFLFNYLKLFKIVHFKRNETEIILKTIWMIPLFQWLFGEGCNVTVFLFVMTQKQSYKTIFSRNNNFFRLFRG